MLNETILKLLDENRDDILSWVYTMLVKTIKSRAHQSYQPPIIGESDESDLYQGGSIQQDISENAAVEEDSGASVSVPDDEKAQKILTWLKGYLISWEPDKPPLPKDVSDILSEILNGVEKSCPDVTGISDVANLRFTHIKSGITLSEKQLQDVLDCLYDAVVDDQIDVESSEFNIQQVMKDLGDAVHKNLKNPKALSYQMLNIPVVLGIWSYFKAKNPDMDPFNNSEDSWLLYLMIGTLVSLTRNIHTYVGAVAHLKEDGVNKAMQEMDAERDAFLKKLSQCVNDDAELALRVYENTGIVEPSVLRRGFLDGGIILGAMASGLSDMFFSETMFKDNIFYLSNILSTVFVLTELLDTGIGSQLIGDRQLDVARRIDENTKLLTPTLRQRSNVVHYLRRLPGMDKFIAVIGELIVPDAMRILRFLPLQSMPGMLGLDDKISVYAKMQYGFMASLLSARNPEVFLGVGKQIVLEGMGYTQDWVTQPKIRYFFNDPIMSSALLGLAVSGADDSLSMTAVWCVMSAGVAMHYAARGLVAYFDPGAMNRVVSAGLDNYFIDQFRNKISSKYRVGLLAALSFLTVDFSQYFVSCFLFVATSFIAMTMLALENRFLVMFLAAGATEYTGDFLDQIIELLGQSSNSTNASSVDSVEDAFPKISFQLIAILAATVAGIFVVSGDKSALVESFKGWLNKEIDENTAVPARLNALLASLMGSSSDQQNAAINSTIETETRQNQRDGRSRESVGNTNAFFPGLRQAVDETNSHEPAELSKGLVP